MKFMQNIIIKNPENFEKIKQKIKKGGYEKLQIVSDFDKTLTACFVHGEKIVSLISILRDGNYLTPDYAEKAQALYDKYHAYEIDPEINPNEKNRLMLEWWKKHYDLLIKSGLTKKDLEEVVLSDKISFRKGALEFFDILHDYQIPLIILSASGVGAETISLYLKKHKKMYSNIKIISNEFIWDKNGKVIGVKEPIIHSLNKKYSAVKNLPLFNQLKNRKNIILLGDGISDAEMADGLDYENIIKIGFFNKGGEDELINFQNNYDMVILNDGSVDPINALLKTLGKED